MGYAITILLSYLLGSSSMAFYLSKIKSVDVRQNGSGNLGASNTTALLGWGAGVLVAVHDIGKAVLAVVLAKHLFPDLVYIGIVAGVACVLGHIFPFYLGFRGGKGFASFWGMTLALNWKLALMVGILAIIVTLVTDYIALATTMTAVVVPVYTAFEFHNLVPLLIMLIATLVMIWKHWENYIRIFKGEEIGLRSAASGKHRIK